MKSKTYTSLSDMIKEAYYDAERGFCVDIVAKDNMAKDTMIELINKYDVKVVMISYDELDYTGEYYLSLMQDKTEKVELYVEPVYHNEKCFTTECDVAYIVNDCDDEVCEKVISNVKIKFQISEDK